MKLVSEIYARTQAGRAVIRSPETEKGSIIDQNGIATYLNGGTKSEELKYSEKKIEQNLELNKTNNDSKETEKVQELSKACNNEENAEDGLILQKANSGREIDLLPSQEDVKF
jgi:hypothetical protein